MTPRYVLRSEGHATYAIVDRGAPGGPAVIRRYRGGRRQTAETVRVLNELWAHRAEHVRDEIALYLKSH